MSPDRDSRYAPEDPDDDYEDLESSRSIFSAPWFRIVVVLLGVAVIGAVAVPYVLDMINPPPPPVMAKAPMVPTGVPTPTPPIAAPPPTPAPVPVPAPAMPPAPATVTPAPAPATAAPAKAKEPPAPAKSPVVAQAPKEEPPAKEPAAKAPPARRERPAPAPAKTAPARTKAAEGGDYFVQVGAFTDPEKAKRVAAQLRAQNYPVEESVKRSGGGAAEPAPRPAPRSTTAPPAAGADRYDVIVTGGSAADLNARLAAKGLAAEPAGEGVRIRPSLPLRDAVALSKDLSADGFKVQVRRSTGGAAPSGEPSAAPGPSGGRTTDAGQALYRVRVGGYPDRATAMGVLKELQGKGFQPFIARGRE